MGQVESGLLPFDGWMAERQDDDEDEAEDESEVDEVGIGDGDEDEDEDDDDDDGVGIVVASRLVTVLLVLPHKLALSSDRRDE